MKLSLNLIDIFFLPRPFLMIPVWGFCIFGYYHGMSIGQKISFGPMGALQSLHAFLWFIVFSLSVASVYILNQIADIDVDKANGGLPLLAQGKISKSLAQIAACFCAAVGVTAPLFKHPVISIFAVATLVSGIAYCLPPLRFSGRPGFDFITNATGFGIIAFGVGWLLSGAPFTVVSFSTAALPYFLLMCAGSISSTIPDYSGDKKYGKNTTAVILGIQKAHFLATLFLCLAMIGALMARHYIPFACALGAFPFYILYFFKRDDRIMEATYKIGGGLCTAFASFLMPVFGGAAVVVTILTLIYFKKRHGINYPALVVTHET
jgi:4-hydroxybenzoate polyprenyltransferase